MTKLSLRAAINAHCRNCIHDPYGGGGHWREQVDACTSGNCALHAVRPRAKRRKPELAQPAAENARIAPAHTEEAATDLSVLLGEVFGHHGAAGEG